MTFHRRELIPPPPDAELTEVGLCAWYEGQRDSLERRVASLESALLDLAERIVHTLEGKR